MDDTSNSGRKPFIEPEIKPGAVQPAERAAPIDDQLKSALLAMYGLLVATYGIKQGEMMDGIARLRALLPFLRGVDLLSAELIEDFRRASSEWKEVHDRMVDAVNRMSERMEPEAKRLLGTSWTTPEEPEDSSTGAESGEEADAWPDVVGEGLN